MTDKKKNNDKPTGIAPSLSSFHLEANRSRRGMSLLVGGIIGISDFSDESVILMSHTGRVSVLGRRLSICVYENNTVEISGRVEDIRFTYGKN